MDYVPRKTIDVWLNNEGYFRKHMAPDETCLFRAVADQVYNSHIHHEKIRLLCVEHAIENRQKFAGLIGKNFNNYIDCLRKHLIRCGPVEMHILADKFKCDFIIFEFSSYSIFNETNYHYDSNILLCKLDGHHYDSVYRKEHMDNTAFCQSIAYKLLYENVFGMKDVEMMSHEMLHQTNSKELMMAERSDTFDDIFRPFPYRVAKALDPNQYRNIEFDSWIRSRKEIKEKDWYFGGNDLKIGTLCIVLLDGNLKECYIQDMYEENNKEKCIIYVKSCVEKRIVDRKDLYSMPNAQPWPTPHFFATQTKDLNNVSDHCVNGTSSKTIQFQKTSHFEGAPFIMTDFNCQMQISNSTTQNTPEHFNSSMILDQNELGPPMQNMPFYEQNYYEANYPIENIHNPEIFNTNSFYFVQQYSQFNLAGAEYNMYHENMEVSNLTIHKQVFKDTYNESVQYDYTANNMNYYCCYPSQNVYYSQQYDECVPQGIIIPFHQESIGNYNHNQVMETYYAEPTPLYVPTSINFDYNYALPPQNMQQTDFMNYFDPKGFPFTS